MSRGVVEVVCGARCARRSPCLWMALKSVQVGTMSKCRKGVNGAARVTRFRVRRSAVAIGLGRATTLACAPGDKQSLEPTARLRAALTLLDGTTPEPFQGRDW